MLLAIERTLPDLLSNELVLLEPANHDNAELLIRWTLHPVAQGTCMRVPKKTPEALGQIFLHNPGRSQFPIQRTAEV